MRIQRPVAIRCRPSAPSSSYCPLVSKVRRIVPPTEPCTASSKEPAAASLAARRSSGRRTMFSWCRRGARSRITPATTRYCSAFPTARCKKRWDCGARKCPRPGSARKTSREESAMKHQMKSGAWSRSVLMAGLLLFATGTVWGQATVKIGVIAEFSGPFADYGAQILGGMKTYLQQNGDVFGGKKIEIVVKDTTGAAPDIAKRLAQETVTRDNVDILAGFGLTPNAMAVAPVATEAKKPMVIMNAATSVITTRSPYIVRVSHTLPQDTQPMAQWAAKNGIKRVFTLVSDFGPGIDAETTFVKAFKAAGGEIVESVRTPLANPDFAPFIQRVKDAKPEAVFVFLPPGSQTIAFIKGYEERGLKAAGIKIIATGDLTDDGTLQAMGDGTIGIVTSFHYSAAHDSQ